MAVYHILVEYALEEERLERRRKRRCLRETLNINLLPDIEFIANYRLSRSLFEELCQEVVPLLPIKRNSRGIDPASKILVALNFYARGSYQGSVGLSTDTPIAQPTVSRCLREVTFALNTQGILQKYIKFPQNAAERNVIKRKFYEKYNLPGVIGCIDCTHIAIVRPSEQEERFFNRKHFHSINTQVICDSDCIILNVDGSYGGTTHDAFIWSQSEIKDHLESLQTETTYLLDLSKNRFSEVPDELTAYVYLEKLLLSQNVIKSVPDAVGGLQSLTYLDLSSNQLTELPREVCQMPLQVLLLSDNTLTLLPKEIGKMTSLAELDASNNRLTQLPMTIGDCAGMRDLDLSNNQLGLLPLQITYLRLEHLDVSCNCISSLPLEFRNMNTLVTLNLDNNPLVSPPTTVCMRGRVHIFKYLENLANKDTLPHRRVEETKRSTKHNSYISSTPNQSGTHQIISGNATIDCLRHKPRHVIDSGYCTDGVDKRWSNDAGGEAGGGSGRSTPSTPSTLSPGAALSRAQSLSSEAPLSAPLTPLLSGQYKEALRQQRQQDIYRPRTDQPSPELDSSPHQSPNHQPLNGHSNVSPLYKNPITSPNTSQVPTPNSPLLHSTPRRFNGNTEKLEETKRPVQKVVPSRNVNKIYSNGNVEYPKINGQADTYIKPTSPTKSPTNTLGYNNLVKSNIPRMNGDNAKLLTTSVSYLKGAPPKQSKWNKEAVNDKLSFTMKREFDKQKEESELLQQLRTIIESRLKMSLPEHLAPVLADGVVLCHLANHVRPRSVASVHVPSPAQPKLTMARCRRNVDNFLEACRRIGVEEEDVCSPEDILDEGTSVVPLARTVSVLLTHATPKHPGNKDITPYNHTGNQREIPTNEPYNFEPDYQTGLEQSTRNPHKDYPTQREIPETYTLEVDYRPRYSEDRYISNFNYIDESEEFQLNYENNNTESPPYSPVYANELRNRGPYYQRNKVQFVTPFYKGDAVLKCDNFEIYDTDVVDFPMEVAEENLNRYDRGKMNLDIQNNLNSEVVVPKEVENKTFYTCLCLGTFVISAILLIWYPL